MAYVELNLREKTFIFKEEDAKVPAGSAVPVSYALANLKDNVVNKFKAENKVHFSQTLAVMDSGGKLVLVETMFYEEKKVVPPMAGRV